MFSTCRDNNDSSPLLDGGVARQPEWCAFDEQAGVSRIVFVELVGWSSLRLHLRSDHEETKVESLFEDPTHAPPLACRAPADRRF